MLGSTIFCSFGGGGHCGTDWSREMVGIAMLSEFDENDRFPTSSSDPFVSHTLKLLFTGKKTQRMILRKLLKQKTRQNA
jgi:hypothetical protein